MKIEMRDPGERSMRLHAVRKQITLDADDKEQWNSFVDGMSGAGANGIPPIFITVDGRIMDGERRWRGAKQLGWQQIACVVRPEEDAAALIIESLIGQRSLLVGAKVYIAMGMLNEFAQSLEGRRLLNLKNGVKTLEKPISSTQLTKLVGRPNQCGSLRDLADKFGCSAELVRQASDLRAKLDANAELKMYWEPKIFCAHNPVGIGAALAGIGGGNTDQSDRAEKMAYSQMSLALERIGENASVWDDPKKRDDVVNEWRKAAAKIPPKIRKAIIEVLESV